MSNTRDTAQKYIDFIAALNFADAFKMLSADTKYRIVGKTAFSKSYSKSEHLDVLGTDRRRHPRGCPGVRTWHRPDGPTL